MSKSQPNIVFVITDDQGYPPMGCHGHPFVQTPELDRFHARATRFEDFHSGTTCAPTRAGLMTGHTCNSTGVWHTIGGRSLLRREEWTLPTALGEAGYRTGIFGKWHLGDDHPYRPEDRGFQTAICHGGGGISQQPDWWGNDYFDDTYLVNGEPKKFDGYCTDVFFSEGMCFIEEHRDEPFFCMISTNAPHGPFNVEPRYRDLYDDADISETYARFLGMITNIDENFGRLRAKLAELELEDNTILIFMSDNGQTGAGGGEDAYNSGMRGLKGSPYEGGHRIPFLMRWPAGLGDTPRRIDTLSGYTDFMPTLLEMCQVAPGAHTFHGESLVSLLHGETSDHWSERMVVTDTQRVADPVKWRQSCVMKNRWRLVNRHELYDLTVDPGQTQNVASDHPDIVAELRAGYEDWWTLCAAQADRETPFFIGNGREVILRTHDLRSDGMQVWNQAQVRKGQSCLGWWPLQVERAGKFRFELRRWPAEAGHAISAAIDEGCDITYDREGVAPGSTQFYEGSRALDIEQAILRISGLPMQQLDISPGDATARFEVDLPEGDYRVRAEFSSPAGLQTAAYYVHVNELAP